MLENCFDPMAQNCAFIHIGLAKTGTKSIQFALAQRRGKLDRAGWFYPNEGTTTNRSGHHGLAWYLQRASHRHPALQKFDAAAFKSAIAAASNRNVIISSEELGSISNDATAVQSLLAMFPAHEVFVVVYVREQAELINSLYAQLLKDLGYPDEIGKFAARTLALDRFNYSTLLNNWKRFLGKRLIVRPFDARELRMGDVVSDFAALLGIEDVLKPLPNERMNTQYNPLQVAVLIGLARLLARRGERWEALSDRHRHIRRLVADILEDSELAMPESYWGLGPVAVRNVRDHYSASNSAFFLGTLGRTFEFSAIEKKKRRNVVAYSHLPTELRKRLEARLIEGLTSGPTIAQRASPKPQTFPRDKGRLL